MIKICLVQILSLLVLTAYASTDPNTFSNYQDVKLDHLHIEWLLNLDERCVNATAVYNFTSTTTLQQVQLDVYQLDILFIYISSTGFILDYTIDVINDQSLIQGDRLTIKLPRAYKIGESFQIKIKYGVDERARALNFLTKEQTSGKKQPYVFSQCEDANCRSMIPLQDTPAVKHTYTAKIITREDIKVFMSGNQTLTQFPLQGVYSKRFMAKSRITNFESKIPFQSYLIAIVAGDIEQLLIGGSIYVISEPVLLPSYAKELEDLPAHMKTLENYVGPYLWGDYKIVILPPSFPFGGMENPLLTFASPSVIVGDKSGVSVAIHEMAHSWTGNTVTCVNWSNFWLNEGFTVFLERKGLLASPQYGLEYSLIDAYSGNSALIGAIDGFGKSNSYSSLYPNTTGVSPDDSFSEVPYEKGFQFLTYLEALIGQDDFQKMFQGYIKNFQYQSIDQQQVRDYFTSWIQQNKPLQNATILINSIQQVWDSWVKVPGYPPNTLIFNTNRISDAEKLAQDYITLNGKQPPNSDDFQSYLTNQKYIFLEYLSSKKAKLNAAIIERIDFDQELTVNNNKELLWRWFSICLSAKYIKNIEAIHIFLGTIGRQKMVLPVYRELNIIDHQLAIEYFYEYESFYHPLARQSIANIINSKSQRVVF